MSSEFQFRVLHLLNANSHVSQRDLLKYLGFGLGAVKYCLNTLISKGSIKIQNFKNNQNKRVYAYLLTPQEIAEKTDSTGSFLKRKLQECQQLKEEIEALSQEALLARSTNKDVSTAKIEVSVN